MNGKLAARIDFIWIIEYFPSNFPRRLFKVWKMFGQRSIHLSTPSSPSCTFYSNPWGDWYFHKGIFPRSTFQVTISQVAIFQMSNFPSGNFPKVRLGLWDALRLEQVRGSSAAYRTDLGSYHLGNCTVGKLPHGKIPLGICRLGKSLW